MRDEERDLIFGDDDGRRDGQMKGSSGTEFAGDVLGQLQEMMGLIDNELGNAYEQYASAKAELHYLESIKSSMLSKYMAMFDGSEAKKKREAELHSEYQEFLKKISLAVGAEQRARGKVEFLKIKCDALRTAISLSKSLI